MKLPSFAIRLALDVANPQAPSEFRLFRAGANETLKGVFMFTEASARSVLAAATDWGVRLSVDYDHAMLDPYPSNPSESGKAAGSFKLAVVDGALMAVDVKWTPAARTAIEAGEWLYISPAFHHSEDGTILEIVNVALTNIPATKGIDPLIALSQRAARALPHSAKETPTMLKTLLAALSLPETTSEAELLAALNTARAASAELQTITGQASASAALGVVRAGVAALASQVAMRAELDRFKSEALAATVEDAIKALKLPPSLREWALKLGATDRTQLDAYLAASAPVVPADSQRAAPPAAGAPVVLTDEQKKVCAMLSLSEADYAKQLAALAAKGTV